ncbi:MAG: polysaccharide deacetylase family protein [Flavobacteriales bacterium]|nr:polysaccharide deacetylase family protein [Flavobacteriales bacterium]
MKCTLFFLAWVAERWPDLVREAIDDGHEIASHGYAHELVLHNFEERFYDDIRKGKHIIEKAGGVEVKGYCCPGFSVTLETPWSFRNACGRLAMSTIAASFQGAAATEGFRTPIPIHMC